MVHRHLKAYEEHSIVESAVGRAGIHEDVYEVDDSSSSDDDGYDKPDENLKKGNKYTRDPSKWRYILVLSQKCYN